MLSQSPPLDRSHRSREPDAAAPAVVLAAAVLASGAADAAVTVPATTDAQALWSACAARLGLPEQAAVRVRRFGDTPQMNDRLLALILAGEKSITATTPWIYERNAELRPVEGGYTVVLDGAGTPRAVLRTTAVKTVRFDEVTAEDSRYEGKPVRPLEAWREVHWQYFARALAPLGRAPAEDMPVTLERFEVACAASGEAPSGLTRINPPALPKPQGYSQIVVAAGKQRQIFIAGQVGMRPDGTIPEDLGEQAQLTFERIGAALAAAGARPADVVRIVVYIVDLERVDPSPVYQAIRAFFPEDARPASTIVGVAALARKGLKLEIDVTAAL